MQSSQTKLVLAITGASGVELGVKFLYILKKFAKDYEIFVVLSNGAKLALREESSISSLEIESFTDNALDAPIASGSFGVSKMAIIPCSMNSLAKIANGISDTLITRSARVMLKERRELLLAPREMPLDSIALKNMLTLSHLNVIIAPPILGYYANIKSLDDMEHFLFGKWLDSLKIEHNLYTRWGELRRKDYE